MPVVDWDDAYANAAHIPDSARYTEQWPALAAKSRALLSATSQVTPAVAYGPLAREYYDLYTPIGHAVGTVVFVHGGYWMRFDPSYWSHLTTGALSHGWAVAMPCYTLCPEIRVPAITRQIANAVIHIAASREGPLRLTGHSAGGHLVTRMLCQDVALPDAIVARVQKVVSISGVHDLRPLMNTELNKTLRLDARTAAAESPALQTPVADVPLCCWVGADERPEFLRQNALLANIWRGFGVTTDTIEAERRHHFNVIDSLADPDSDLVRTLLS